jgi:ABC-2 type transport system ATP-binding protein
VAVPGDATAVTLPTVSGEPIASPQVIWRYVLAGLLAAIAGMVVGSLAPQVLKSRHEKAQTHLA